MYSTYIFKSKRNGYTYSVKSFPRLQSSIYCTSVIFLQHWQDMEIEEFPSIQSRNVFRPTAYAPLLEGNWHSRPQRPRSFWSAPRIATSGQVQHRKSAIHGLPVTLRMLRVKFDKSDWFWSQSIVFTKPFKNGMPLD